MQMITLVFFGFLIAVLAALRMEEALCRKNSALIFLQKWTLLAASFVFMAYANVWFAVILALQCAITWYCAGKEKRIPFGIVSMVLFLGFFKYSNFFMDSFAKLLGSSQTVFLNLLLPLGISFYSFSAISYLADVKRGKQQPRSLTDVALYLSFFPKLTSGPIARSGDFFRQTDQPRIIRSRCLSEGLQIFVFGVFKKMVLADQLSIFVGQVYRAPQVFDSLTVLLAVLSYSMQIYFDFSGYSDMAIGVAKMMDIDLPRNFNLPYLSHNVTELWKRWHITLSSWLQEYLYIPLGGNRKGRARTYLNLFLTMVIGGLWHGASWTYIVWGALHGLGLSIHKLWAAQTNSSKKPHSLPANLLAIAVTFLFTSFCWIFFRADSLSQAFLVSRQIFSFREGIRHLYLWTFVSAAVLIGAQLLAALRSGRPSGNTNQSPVSGYYPLVSLDSFWGLVGFFVFCGLIWCLANTGGSPFIYGAY